LTPGLPDFYWYNIPKGGGDIPMTTKYILAINYTIPTYKMAV
jgi:hypothetical protein